jgi:molybdopterin/thiamine biosynthesis adenylyltransferase
MAATPQFNYETAFARNLGLVSEEEQGLLRNTRVALPGLGRVGGAHVQALARMGIAQFHLADPDTFDLANFNRQLGATMTTVGSSKAAVMEDLVRSINPEAGLRVFGCGIDAATIDHFLDGVDVVVDGIEFFCMEARRLLYRECRTRGIPVVNAGPIGYGASLLVFLPDGPSFDAYFGLSDSQTRAEQLLSFGLGLGPGLSSDLDPARIDFKAEKGPALAPACLMCAALAATEVLKLVTKRGTPTAAPNGVYFDPFRGQITPLRPVSAIPVDERVGIFARCFDRFPALLEMHLEEVARCVVV